jgi:2-dehydro-3-deoxyphosphogluconate aldolase / (4S)-4-hydroxy-2-oxoglutarate aldolase
MDKYAVLELIRTHRLIALIRADDSAHLIDCVRALREGGVRIVELTLTTPGALAQLPGITRECPDVILGVGTVLGKQACEASLDAGARFIVTPAIRREVLAVTTERNIATFCGALTPTEVCDAVDLGADVVKIFPAEYFGPAYLKSLRGPLPNVRLLPTGGVTPETIPDFLANGAFAVAAGSAMVDAKAYRNEAWGNIARRAAEFVAALPKPSY